MKSCELESEGKLAYKIIECCHEGTERCVYRVQLQGGRGEAILKMGNAAELAQEYALLRQLWRMEEKVSPYPIAFWQENDTGCLLREYIAGQTLLSWRDEQETPIPEQTLSRLGRKVCRVLHLLHTQNLVLRDVKPENFIIDAAGRLYLIDVGTMRQYDTNKSQDTQLVGTVGYAAPEQYGFGQTSSRTDIYGMGIMMLKLSTGESDVKQLKTAKIPRRIRHFIKRCTAFDPKRRYRSITTAEKDLASTRKPALLPGLLVIIALAGFGVWHFTASPYPNAIRTSAYATLQEAVDAATPFVKQQIWLDRDWTLDSTLIIGQRQVELIGKGTITDSAAMAGTPLVEIHNDSSLTVREGITLRTTNGGDAISCNGVFVLDGGRVSVSAENGGMLFINFGTLRMVSGTMERFGSTDWAAITGNLFLMQGGIIHLYDANEGILNNSGRAEYQGGCISLGSTSSSGSELPIWRSQDGYDVIGDTILLVNGRVVE